MRGRRFRWKWDTRKRRRRRRKVEYSSRQTAFHCSWSSVRPTSSWLSFGQTHSPLLILYTSSTSLSALSSIAVTTRKTVLDRKSRSDQPSYHAHTCFWPWRRHALLPLTWQARKRGRGNSWEGATTPPLSPARVSGERCKLPSGVWGKAPVAVDFGVVWSPRTVW